ncbi:MAG: hypothetical protein JNK48_13665 [Bryobacterales bacterium]|nr:hypothetical protein [Bryobacterales bacterium]
MLRIVTTILLPAALLAQPTVAPTREDTGNPRGENKGAYNILNSFETGYRFRTVDGNYGKYRSDVNFGNGIRLLGSQLRVNSREGHGKLFDDLSLTTQGLGNDPYQSAALRIEKNRFYRYDMLWRLNEYYNPALTVSFGQHLLDTRRRFQDHDFTLFPQSSFKLFGGYTRNSQTGPGLITTQLFDSRGDEFPLFLNIDRRRTEYRLGGEATLLGFKLNILRGWDRYEEDSPINAASLAGNNTADNTRLTSLRRTEPYQGDAPYWRIALIRNERKYGVNARYSNVSGRRDFVFDELASGANRLGIAQNRQILVAGGGSRPVVSGSLNISFLPTSRLTLTNHTSFHNTRMDGSGSYREINNANAQDAIFNFQFLGIRSIQTLTDATVALNNIVSVYGGYHFSDRRIRSREGQTFGQFTDVFSYQQNNRLNSGLGGLRLRPIKPLTIQLDAEVGRSDRPFLPIAEKNYHAFNGRIQYKLKSLQLSALTRTLYNTNTANLFAHSARSRQYSYDASWAPSSWFSFDAGYSKLHLDTLTGIAYFAASQLVESNRSLYVSNIHSANFGMRAAIRKRADLYIGYSLIKDTGDGRATTLTNTDAFYLAQTFPLSYQSPQARFSLRLHNRLRWNLGYQHYAYREGFFTLTYQNYRAHTGYASLLWSF